MSTLARTISQNGSHFYFPDGRPCYEVPRASGGGMRPTTLADARKWGLLPSVTTILSVLDKPGLNTWKTEQAVLAAITTPRLPRETDDAFLYRVLHVERQQDQEAAAARELGTDIHNALETLFSGGQIDDELVPWVDPIYQAIRARGPVLAAEACLVGDGYAGKTDLIQDDRSDGCIMVWDFKSAKNLPEKGAWPEHRLQLSAYAAAYRWRNNGHVPAGLGAGMVRTGNVYISTREPGQFVICPHGPWEATYEAFEALLKVWCWQNQFWPQGRGKDGI